MLVVRILQWTRCFSRVPRRWTGSVQMKSSMTFIRGNRCIEREKVNFKSHEVKRLNECAQALNWMIIQAVYYIEHNYGYVYQRGASLVGR